MSSVKMECRLKQKKKSPKSGEKQQQLQLAKICSMKTNISLNCKMGENLGKSHVVYFSL